MENNVWTGKRIYVRTKSNRIYSGECIAENYISITLRDIKGHQVLLNFDEISLLQEEERGYDKR